jgi:chromosome segregation ATPase
MTPTKVGTTTGEQINYLVDRINEGFEELKEHINQLDDRLRKMEQTDAACIPVMNARIDHVNDKLKEHENSLTTKSQQIKTLEAQVARLANMYAIMTWIFGALGISVIGLIWALITGQAEVIFR